MSTMPLYRITDLGALPSSANWSAAYGINNRGQVVGASAVDTAGGNHAFLWDSGNMTDLGVLPGGIGESEAWGINEAGQAAGWSSTAAGTRAFLWESGTMVDLGVLAGGTYSVAYGINDRAQVVGSSTAAGIIGRHAFLWESGTMTDLGDLPGGDDYSSGVGINNAGQVACSGYVTGGAHAFVWESGILTDLGDLPGGSEYSKSHAINNIGQVVGTGNSDDGIRSFLWQSGNMTDLGDAPLANGFFSPNAINNCGQVIGTLSGVGRNTTALLWCANRGIIDLNDRIDPNDSLSGTTKLLGASDINDQGQIVGHGLIGDANHGFLLTPLPAPPHRLT